MHMDFHLYALKALPMLKLGLSLSLSLFYPSECYIKSPHSAGATGTALYRVRPSDHLCSNHRKVRMNRTLETR